MKLHKGKQFGLIAQDVEQVLPQLVKDSKFHTAKAQPPQLDSSRTRATREGEIAPPLMLTVKREVKGEIIDFKAVITRS